MSCVLDFSKFVLAVFYHLFLSVITDKLNKSNVLSIPIVNYLSQVPSQPGTL